MIFLKFKKIKLNSKRLKWLIISLLIVVPLGFYTKFYSGVAQNWVNNSLGGIFYEIFFCLLVYLFFPQVKPIKIVSIVFITTCFLEVLQLWHPPILIHIRKYFLGQALLGTSFSWSDFFHYFIGCTLGYIWIKNLARFNK